MSGSIAAFKAAAVVSDLVKNGCEVQCVFSSSAHRFVGEATFEGLTGRRVLSDLWESGQAMDHIELSRWADFAMVCPASANCIAKIALGLSDDLLTSCLLAWPRSKPLYVFPAMNTAMWTAPSTQAHVATLRERGVIVAETEVGSLACGEVGEGRLLEPEKIIEMVGRENVSRASGGPGRKILITSGATRERIDGIRFITNHSTGRTGAELCDEFAKAGWTVTCLHGEGAVLPARFYKRISFFDYADLEDKLRSELAVEKYAAIVHCAAVSDYTVDEVSHSDSLASLQPRDLAEQKIQSGGDLVLHLSPTPKLLPQLKEFSQNKQIFVVGFKLTLNAERTEMLDAGRLILSETVDAVVANDWSQVRRDGNTHPCCLIAEDQESDFRTVSELAHKLTDLIERDQGEP